MKRSRFDTKPIQEVIGDLVSERCSQGDTITLNIMYNGEKKPLVVLEFNTLDPEKRNLPANEDISDWLPAKPSYTPIGDDGKPLDGVYTNAGYENWRDLVHNKATGLGALVEHIARTRGCNFKFKER